MIAIISRLAVTALLFYDLLIGFGLGSVPAQEAAVTVAMVLVFEAALLHLDLSLTVMGKEGPVMPRALHAFLDALAFVIFAANESWLGAVAMTVTVLVREMAWVRAELRGNQP